MAADRGSREPRLPQLCAGLFRLCGAGWPTGVFRRCARDHRLVPAHEPTISDVACRIVELEFRDRARVAELLAQIAVFDERGGPRRWGHATTADWLAAECTMDKRTAREYVRVARRLRQWSQIADALALCQLSYCQVRALTRAEETEDETELLRVARGRTVRQIEQHVRGLRSSRSADLDCANGGRARRHVTYFYDEVGSLHFFGRLPAEQGAAFVESLEACAEDVDGPADGPCRRAGWSRAPIRARRADALVDLVTAGGAATHLVLHADPEALACQAERRERRAGNVLHLRDGPAIPSALARRLACDCSISFAELNHGRGRRLVTARQRAALELRDGRVCAFPGCDRTHGLAAHHIVHWIHGGRTDLDNLALLCTAHHHLLHEGRFTTRRRDDGTLAFADPRGHEIHRLPSRAAPHLAAAG